MSSSLTILLAERNEAQFLRITKLIYFSQIVKKPPTYKLAHSTTHSFIRWSQIEHITVIIIIAMK